MAKSLGRSSLAFAAMTLLSRFLGLIRDILIARYFDTSITDPYLAALRIPNTLRRFFAEGSFTNAFVPVFSATKATDPEDLTDLLRHVTGTLATVLFVITVLGVMFAGSILTVVAGGLANKAEQFILAEQMLRIMFPYILLISLTALASSVLNSHEHFAVGAFTPVLLNISLIIACLLGDGSGLELAWGVLIGGILQLSLQIPFLKRLNLLVFPCWGWKHKGVKRIFELMLPTLFGSSVGQLTVLLNTFLAAGLATGSISWLYYADRMVELPVALIGVALGTVILPKLSALEANNDGKKFALTLDWALRWGFLGGTAAASMLIILAPATITTLFYRGAFTVHDVLMSTQALQVYGVGSFFLILVKVLTPAFYSRQDTKTPVKAGLVAMAINIVAAITLSRYFAHLGLAAATAIASIANVLILFYFLYKDGLEFKKDSLWFLGRVFFANGALISVLNYLHGDLDAWLLMTSWERWRNLILIVISSFMVYFLALLALGLRKNQLSGIR